jgi:hypothetical protein
MSQKISLKQAALFAYHQYRNNIVLFSLLFVCATGVFSGFSFLLHFLEAPLKSSIFAHSPVTPGYHPHPLLVLPLFMILSVYYYSIISLAFQAMKRDTLSLKLIIEQRYKFLKFFAARLWLLLKVSVFTLPAAIFQRFMPSEHSLWFFLTGLAILVLYVIALSINLVYFFSGFFIADEKTDSVRTDEKWNRYLIRNNVLKVLVLVFFAVVFEALIYSNAYRFNLVLLGGFFALTYLYLTIAHCFTQLIHSDETNMKGTL